MYGLSRVRFLATASPVAGWGFGQRHAGPAVPGVRCRCGCCGLCQRRPASM